MAIAVAVRAICKTDPRPPLVRMTALAFQTLMGLLQTKCRSRVVESNFLEPDFWRVAPLAVFSQPSAVNVGMAGNAAGIIDQESRRHLARRCIFGFVARFARFHPAMKAHQRVSGLGMVERGRSPAQ